MYNDGLLLATYIVCVCVPAAVKFQLTHVTCKISSSYYEIKQNVAYETQGTIITVTNVKVMYLTNFEPNTLNKSVIRSNNVKIKEVPLYHILTLSILN